METLEYKGILYNIITNDPKVTKYNHCNFCEFATECDNYIDENLWFACDCTFNALPIYLKKV